jgi:stearoyl-CoA desaturase (delta-9 desaturase)
LKPRRKPGASDVSDLKKNDISRWQDKNYLYIMLIMAFVVPTVIAGLFWGDWKGGYFYAGAVRLVLVHHVSFVVDLLVSEHALILFQSTFCINSLAHYLGDSPFDDKLTPRDNVITALVTVGEGYHNFHHQFPMDYRNAIKWYQYDPTKWFIWSCGQLGLASQLKVRIWLIFKFCV